MRKSLFLACLGLALTYSGIPASTNQLAQTPAKQQAPTQNGKRLLSPSEQHAEIVENFKAARELLRKKGVPFDPDILMSPQWLRRLGPKLARMPEMQMVRRPGMRLKGVQLADTLYLPERVELTGDTVILANRVIFEGRDALLKGNFNVYFFTVVTEGVLGATLESAMKEQGFESASVRAHHGGVGSYPVPPKNFVPRLLQEGWSLTIDTSGRGFMEWYEEQNKAARVSFVRTSFQGGTTNHDGSPGNPGATGTIGNMGSAGTPSPSLAGDNGSCGSPNGFGGFPGNPGGTGKNGFDGGVGMAGGDATKITSTINTATGIYNFYARGGQGGQGGKGGQGGTGGLGADGGKGGDGADCPCNEGGAGNGKNGGMAGQGGKGGKGGNGGPGGFGGAGDNIVLNLPSNFIGTIGASALGGVGGPGGEQGDGGFPGTSGSGGLKGRKATTFNCSSSNPVDGDPGLPRTPLGFGPIGDFTGESRTGLRAASGTVAYVDRQCTVRSGNGGGSCDELQNCPAGSRWNVSWCECVCNTSPILIDTLGNGFNLTDAAGGVNFDLKGNGFPDRFAWTALGSDDAFLGLDRNGNGLIDDGTELFGNYTLQPMNGKANGFRALNVYDWPENGGNDDGVIDARDAIFSSLRLWQDINHNGISEASELQTLPALDIAALHFDARWSWRKDQYGNEFSLRAKVDDERKARIGRWAWDVFLVQGP